MENNTPENGKCNDGCSDNGSAHPKIPATFYDNNPDVRVAVNKDLELKEDEVILCLGSVQGNSAPEWMTVQFSMKTTDANTYTDEIIGKLICLLFHKAAVHHGWVNLGREEGEVCNAEE